MEHTFENRVACLRAIREFCGDDNWRTRYALMAALNHLDLEGVNVVRRALEVQSAYSWEDQESRLQLLLRERWG